MKYEFTYWEDHGVYLGFLNEFPDYWTQGENLDDLKEHLRDLFKDLNSGEIPCIRRVSQLELV